MAGTRYAVLISGDLAENGFDEFWNDVVLMRQMLLDNGFQDQNIFVLYGNGNDFFDPNRPVPAEPAHNGLPSYYSRCHHRFQRSGEWGPGKRHPPDDRGRFSLRLDL